MTKNEIADLIALQKRIIANPKINEQIRSIMNQNLILFKQLMEENKRYSEDATIGEIRKIYTLQDVENKDPLVSLLKEVQEHLTKNYAELVNMVDDDPNIKEQLKDIIRTYVQEHKLESPHFKTQEGLIQFLINDLLGLSVLEEALNGKDKDKIQEIQVNDFNDIRFIIDGKEERTDLAFRNAEHQRLLADRLSRAAGKNGQAENLSDDVHYIRLRYQDTTRISIIDSPLAHGGVTRDTIQMAIRTQQSQPFTREFLLEKGSIDEYGDALLELFVKYGVSINAYGGTGTGKTAMLRRYLTAIPNNKRVITMAEIDEMNLRRIDTNRTIINDEGVEVDNPNYLRAINSVLMWECTDPKTKVFGELCGFSGLVNAALTFTPDVIVLQESKSGEIKDVIDAAVSGHQVFTTIHANTPEAFFIRILLMYQQAAANISDTLIQKQIPLAFPVIVNFKRYSDGSRKIAEITELIGYDAIKNEPITKPILQYNVLKNLTDEKTGKMIIEGGFYANEEGFLSPRLLKILRDNGAEERDINNVEVLYSKTKKCKFHNGIAVI